MPYDLLPAKLLTFPRDKVRDKWIRDYGLHNPGALLGPGTEPYIKGSTFADNAAAMYQDAILIANSISRATAVGPDLDVWAVRGGTARLPPSGASGAVTISATSSGTTIIAGDEIRVNGLRYQCAATDTYLDGAQVPVIGIDTGPGTDQNAGVIMTWSRPRPGCGDTATVVLQEDGSGLSNGRDTESDQELRARLDFIAANPPASGNDAQYQQSVLVTPLLSVQACFTYPAILGGNTIGVVFTLSPSSSGANRIPNATQVAAVTAAITYIMPADDVIFVGTVVSSPVNVALRVTWANGAIGWADATPWPPYASPMTKVKPATSPTALAIRVTNSTTAAPQVGQTLGFFDSTKQLFRRKKILTVAALGGGDYDLTFDTTNGASDTSYTPWSSAGDGQVMCPWSDSLDTLTPPVITYFDFLGPGEQQAAPYWDLGLRQKRSPANPQFWPSSITTRLLGGPPANNLPVDPNAPPKPTLLTTPSIGDVSIQEPAVPYACPAGTPGIASFLLTLNTLVAFPP